METSALPWPPASSVGSLASNEVHVWRANLEVSSNQSENLLSILSVDEIERALRFRFERDQKRFIAARGILRKILARYLDIMPEKICFRYSANGKPFIENKNGYDPLYFNLSHADDYALIGFSGYGNIGIDIEKIRDDVAVMQIAGRFFSRNEIGLLEAVNGKSQTELFFKYWTRKEAFIKATGKGVSFPLEQCDVSSDNGKNYSPVRLLNEPAVNTYWYFQDLFPVEGYAGAIVAEDKNWITTCLTYDE